MVLRVSVPVVMTRRLRRIAGDYKCDLASLALVALEELVAAHRRPRVQTSARRRPTARRGGGRRRPDPVPASAPIAPLPAAGRAYAPKACACGATFTPTGPRSTKCAKCRDAVPPAPVVVWNGAMGRNGKPLPRPAQLGEEV